VCSVPTSATLAYSHRNPATMAIGQHALRESDAIPVPTRIRPQAGKSSPLKNRIVRRAGKSITQMLLWGIK